MRVFEDERKNNPGVFDDKLLSKLFLNADKITLINDGEIDEKNGALFLKRFLLSL